MVWRDAVERRDREQVKTRAVLAEHQPNPTERQRVADGFGTLRDRFGRAEPTPEAYANRLEELGAAYARIPPTVSTQVMEKYLTGLRGEPIEFDESA